MPLYEYACPACHRVWEALQDRWDSPAPECPECGKSRGERRLSPFAVVATPSRKGASTPGPCGSADCGCRRAQQ